MNRRKMFLWIAAISVTGWTGCGPSSGPALGTVSGTVTLDGQPLPNAMVSFYPNEQGRSSHGTTDADGQYQLKFTGFKDGAMVGQHTVKIETGVQMSEDAPSAPKRQTQLPEIYNENSELGAEVTRGSNTFDFDLSSK